MGDQKLRKNIEKIADLLGKQEWAKIIPEIPQSEIHCLKNKNRRSAGAEERNEDGKANNSDRDHSEDEG